MRNFLTSYVMQKISLFSICQALLALFFVCSVEQCTMPIARNRPSQKSTKGLLPADFLKTTRLADVKRIARERAYVIRMVLPGDDARNLLNVLRSLDVIDELCKSENLEEIDAGLELALEAKRGPVQIASFLASSHTPRLREAIITRHVADGKFLSVIKPFIQESVARGANYESVDSIVSFWRKLKSQKEPLTWLPLHCTSVERTITFRVYSNLGSCASMPSSSEEKAKPRALLPEIPGKPFTAIEEPISKVEAGRCVRQWVNDSNGKLEAKLFVTSLPISPSDISAEELLKLPLECLAGSNPGEVKVDAVPIERVFAVFFSAAANGGAYSHGEEGAYGRLAAWKTLAALVGVESSGSFDSVYSAVEQSNWRSISTTTKWFHKVAWDFGYACLRPDKRHIAIIAATDED